MQADLGPGMVQQLADQLAQAGVLVRGRADVPFGELSEGLVDAYRVAGAGQVQQLLAGLGW